MSDIKNLKPVARANVETGKPYKVTFIATDSDGCEHEIVEWHRNMADARLRASALNWYIESSPYYGYYK